MSKKTRKHSNVAVLNFVLTLIIITMNFWLIYFAGGIAYFETKLYFTGCTGIDKWFTNTTFRHDETMMFMNYRKCYNYTEVSDAIKTPEELCDGTAGFDCEDYAHSVTCLGKMYNITCSDFYMKGHVGVECNIDNEWITFG